MGIHRDWAKCIECGEREMVPKRAWIRANRPRCKGCGGTLEPSADAYSQNTSHNDAANEGKTIRDIKTNRKRN